VTEKQDIINVSLKQVARGTGIASIGLGVSFILAFISKLLVARYGTEAEYGIFSLATTVFLICATIGTLGLQSGLSRSIAYARSKMQDAKVQGFIKASLQFTFIASIILAIILLAIADILAENVFHEPALGTPLRMLALAIPFIILIRIVVSIFLGFEQVKAKVFFQDIIRNGIFPLVLLIIISLHLSFNYIYYAYLASFIVTCLLLIIFAMRHIPSKTKLLAIPRFDHTARELFTFSMPLLGIAMIQLIIGWTDTIMLGYFRSTGEVGLYNVSFPLAHFVVYPLTAVLIVYQPVMSRLYGQDLVREVGRTFTVISKWVFFASLPLSLAFFLFPEAALGFMFGEGYIEAAGALRILSLGWVLSNLMGPNGGTLIAMGRSIFMMWAILAIALINVILNIVLIPTQGIEGAAIASAAAIVAVNIVRCWKLHSLTGAWPISLNLVKPAVLVIGLAALIEFTLGGYVQENQWMLLLIIPLFYCIHGMAVVITRSFDDEDKIVLQALKRRIVITASGIRGVKR